MRGVVLAGGGSRRLGSDKSEVRVDGEPLWARQVRVLRAAGASPVFLVRRPGQPSPPGIACLRDAVTGAGPLAGLQAGLSAGAGALVAVLAVDMPGIGPGWFRWLGAHCRPGRGAIVRQGGFFEPLAAIYPAEALGVVAAHLGRRRLSLQDLVGELVARGLLTVLALPAVERGAVASLNTPEALAAFPGAEPPELAGRLRAAGLIRSAALRLTPMAGGVSSDIWLVEDEGRRFVVKRALAKLRVRDDWRADVGRNRTEQDYFDYAGRVAPEAVPRVLHASPGEGWFAMEFLGDGLLPWKADLMAGRADPAVARRAGEVLGRIHAASWGDPEARARFATLRNFTDLRISPYLLTTAARVPAVRGILEAEAERLGSTALALVHGDYSPKNLMVGPGRLVVLDAETAWFGDPAFDTAFLLNHLHLKALVHASAPGPFLDLAAQAWAAYASALGPGADRDLEARTARLVLCLMLARVRGKSPAEYLDPAMGDRVADFACRHLPRPPATMAALSQAWLDALPVQPMR
jgi:molybdopterin-guanine dinucleotide biosynthesis protein A/aminoglycoside phosphotransferase (APT) family kinase protein